jgi:hypothetical protein
MCYLFENRRRSHHVHVGAQWSTTHVNMRGHAKLLSLSLGMHMLPSRRSLPQPRTYGISSTSKLKLKQTSDPDDDSHRQVG